MHQLALTFNAKIEHQLLEQPVVLLPARGEVPWGEGRAGGRWAESGTKQGDGGPETRSGLGGGCRQQQTLLWDPVLLQSQGGLHRPSGFSAC